jgi:DMSO/TMAO reductase YedYZ heme-binding membrane subunit
MVCLQANPVSVRRGMGAWAFFDKKPHLNIHMRIGLAHV